MNLQSQRIEVASLIQHPEEYYQQALKSKGIDYTQLTHEEICVHVATMKLVEADILIELSFKLPIKQSYDDVVNSIVDKYKN